MHSAKSISRYSSALLIAITSAASAQAQGVPYYASGVLCPPRIRDAAVPNTCIGASSVPVLGALYPLSFDFNVDDYGSLATGRIGPYRIGNDLEDRILTIDVGASSTYGGDPIIELARNSSTDGVGNGDIQFINSDNATDKVLGCIQALTVGNSTDKGGALRFFTKKKDGGQPMGVRMVIRDDGKIGIGTQTPNQDVEIGGPAPGNNGIVLAIKGDCANAAILELNNTNVAGHDWVLASWGAAAGAGVLPGKLSLFDNTAGAHRLIIDTNGNVGIGTNVYSPAYKLEVAGTAHRSDNSSTWTVASDARLKKNVHTLDGALETLLALRGVSFEYKDPEQAGVRRGFIAQEVEQVLPEWVAVGPDGYKSLTVNGFEALTVEGMRELESQNAALREKNAALEARVAHLESMEAQFASLAASVQTLLEKH